MIKPWRGVKHIEIVDGPRGGRTWVLTLVCGHIERVKIPRFNITKFMFGQTTVRTAPTRVRCLMCGLRESK